MNQYFETTERHFIKKTKETQYAVLDTGKQTIYYVYFMRKFRLNTTKNSKKILNKFGNCPIYITAANTDVCRERMEAEI